MEYNVNEVFDRYTNNENLKEANIFHLYDTGEKCIENNSGYHDSRHFNLIAFNTETMEKCNLGRHDGIENINNNLSIDILRVYADGSFFVRLKSLAKISNFQCVTLS